MVPVREMPKKSLPISLLLDLRRRGIRVPVELQMYIMYLKEVTEIRETKDWAMMQIRGSTVCSMFMMAHYCGEYQWRSLHKRVQNLRLEPTACHWCQKVRCELLSIGMRAELSRPVPNLDRLYNEGGWVAEELYRLRCNGEPVGTHLRNLNRRGPALNTPDDVMKWTVISVFIVDLMTDMSTIMNVNAQ